MLEVGGGTYEAGLTSFTTHLLVGGEVTQCERHLAGFESCPIRIVTAQWVPESYAAGRRLSEVAFGRNM